jgi:predicted ArsR family transcriptional regulator
VPDDLTPPETDPDDVEDDERLPDELEPDEPHLNGGRRSPILEALRELGPASAREIAQKLNREAGNVSTQLRGYEEAGKVRRTGRSVQQPGQRGGPSIEWELMRDGDEKTAPGTADVDLPAGSPEARIRGLSERIGSLAAQLEAAENAKDAATQRAQIAERRATDANAQLNEQRRQREALELQRSDLQREVERLSTRLDAAEEDEAVVSSLAQSELDAIAELVGLANADNHNEVRERVRELVGNLEHYMGKAAELEQARLAGLNAGPDVRPVMRPDGMVQVYFDFLMKLAGETRDEHLFDRIERLLEGGTHGD